MYLKNYPVISCLLILLLSCRQEAILYVDQSIETTPNANGSIESPFRDVESALNAVHKIRGKDGTQQIKIIFRKGTYYFDKGFLIDQSLSNLIITAYPEESVIFSGGKPIPVNLIRQSRIGDNEVQVIDLKKAGIHDYGKIKNTGFSRPFSNSWGEFFINNKPMHLSRWPNKGMIRMGKIIDEGSVPRNNDFKNRGAIMEYDSLRVSSWEFTDDMWISGYFKYGYADDALRIASLNKEKKTITTAGPTLYGFYSGYAWNKWFAFNIKEETDEPGEYFLERTTGKLYFISPDSEIGSLHLSILEEPFFDIWQAENIQIKNITFEYSRGTILSLSETENVCISGCTFRNSGDLGVIIGNGISPFKEYLHEGNGKPVRGTAGSLQQHLYANQTFNRQGGHNNQIDHCIFYNLGAGGVSMGGGDRKTLQAGNNIVSNCLFHANNRIAKSYRPAVHITGVGNRIVHCEMYDSPSMAILMHGNNHLIENNYIHDVCLEVEDQGAFYYGRNPSECGTIIRNNLFADIPDTYSTCAIYHDDGAGGLTVENNIFYRAGKYAVLMGGGSDNTYKNNLFINGQIGIHADNRLQNWGKSLIAQDGLFEKRLKEINYKEEPYSSTYPYLKDYIPNDSLPKRNRITGNRFIGIGKTSDNPQLLIWENNTVKKNTFKLDSYYSMEMLLKELSDKNYRTTDCSVSIGMLQSEPL